MTKIIIRILLSCLFFASWPDVHAEQAQVRRIGVLYPGRSGVPLPQLDGFRQALRELGYAEGINVDFVYRFAEGKLYQLPDLAAELVRLNVDVILAAGGTPAILAAKKATAVIPIVFPAGGDPVHREIVENLARPGGNITGFTTYIPSLYGKTLELMKELVPRTKRMAVLGQAGNVATGFQFKRTQSMAPDLGMQIQQIEVRGMGDFETAFLKMTRLVRVDALYIQSASIFLDNGKRLADLAIKSRLPAIYNASDLAAAGLLASYGPDRVDLGRQAAAYVDRILKGAKPADLPVQQPRKLELVVNLQTAPRIGVSIPPIVLQRADRVIE